MLSETEKIKCRSMLERFPDEQLKSLCDTITKKQITAETRNDKIKAIIDYSNSAEELLKRKKIRRVDLLQYLADVGICVLIADKKHTLIQKVLEYWRQGDAAVQAQLQHPEQDINPVTNMFENLNIASQQQSSQPDAPTASVAASSTALPQLQMDVTQHMSQVHNQSPTVSDVESQMDESISTNYGAGATSQTSQVTSPARQNQVQCVAQNIASLVLTIVTNSVTNTVDQRNNQGQMSVRSNLTTEFGITNPTLPTTTTTRPPVPTPNPAPQP